VYSIEDRNRAVELWLRYDRSPTAVVMELGYPSIKMLKAWGKEYLLVCWAQWTGPLQKQNKVELLVPQKLDTFKVRKSA